MLTALLLAATLSEKKPGHYDFSATWPTIKGRSALVRLANQTVDQIERKRYREYVVMAKKEVPELRRIGSGTSVYYEANTQIQLQTPRVISLTTNTATFLGGAHGVSTTLTYNFGQIAGKPKRLRLNDITRPDARREVLLRLLGKATADPHTDWIQDGSFTGFTETQADRFWISRQGLTWEFDPYELGSYASGPFTFRLTWAELRDVLRPGMPGALLN